METVRQVVLALSCWVVLALSCLGLYFVQTELDEALMGIKTRKEELATGQFCAEVSSTRKKIE